MMKPSPLLLLLVVSACTLTAAESLKDLVAKKVSDDYPSLEALYKHFHANPELSLMEEGTSLRLAKELRSAGYDVTEKFGGHGVVGVLKNGPGKTLLIRADMDALPVMEETGLSYASKVRTKDLSGRDVGVMHACGHDVHMTCLVGVARTLVALRSHWSGTVVLVGQPAEELGAGARQMLSAGLYQRFPKPDFAIALHDIATLPAGTVGVLAGPVFANVDFLDITVRGVGGHGAYPHMTKDPIVLAARIVGSLQTIVSRETRPIDPVVVTIGSFHGGTKHNIIPDEAKLQLTVRTYSDEVRTRTLAAIERICRGEALAAGMPEDRMPTIEIDPHRTPVTTNAPDLTGRVRAALVEWLGDDRLRPIDPEMGGDDFSEFGRTAEQVPLCYFRLGAVDPAWFAKSEQQAPILPSLHSSKFAPVPEPTLKTGVTAFTGVALNLLGGN